MRIVAGKYRGFVFPKAKGYTVRPTTDRAKESLFNVLHHRIHWDEVEVLDLFSGTGNVGAEFLSRGVQHVTSVDTSGKSVSYIKRVKDELQARNWTVIRKDVFQFITDSSYDSAIIFADPPYTFGKYPELLNALVHEQDSGSGGIVIIEHPTHVILSDRMLWRKLEYGQSAFSIYSLGHESFTK